MPEIRIHGFHLNAMGFPGAQRAWRWANSDDDSEFITFVQSVVSVQAMRNCEVDRSGSTPELLWDVYEFSYPSWVPTGNSDSLPLVENVIYAAWSVYPEPLRLADASVLGGWWESDQYGRPYDLNDLLAES